MKFVYLIWRNLLRKKLRTLLTLLSITVAFIIFGLLSALQHAFQADLELTGNDRLIMIHKVSIIQSFPKSYATRVKQVPGVKAVTHANWFGAYYQDPKNQFAQLPVDIDSYFDVYPEIIVPEEDMSNFKRTRIGALVGRALAEKFNWSVGDKISLISSIHTNKQNSQTWEFEISGIFDLEEASDTRYMLFHYDYFDEARLFGNGNIGWMILSVDDPDSSTELAKTLDALFENSAAETKTSTEKAFAQAFAKQFVDISLITRSVMVAVFFTMLLLAGNTMAQAVRERIPDLAVMKTIGFSSSTLFTLILAESLFLALLGGALGMGFDALVIQGMGATITDMFPAFALTPSIWGSAVILMIFFGLMTGILPAFQAIRISIVDAFRRA